MDIDRDDLGLAATREVVIAIAVVTVITGLVPGLETDLEIKTETKIEDGEVVADRLAEIVLAAEVVRNPEIKGSVLLGI